MNFQQSTEDVKKMLAKLMNGGDSEAQLTSSSSASTSSISKPKPTDISHLIKRKKPDTSMSDDDTASSAKKPST